MSVEDIKESYLKSNPIRPHSVKLIVSFEDNGKIIESEVKWDTILSLLAVHNAHAVAEIYALILENNK